MRPNLGAPVKKKKAPRSDVGEQVELINSPSVLDMYVLLWSILDISIGVLLYVHVSGALLSAVSLANVSIDFTLKARNYRHPRRINSQKAIKKR